MKTLNQLLERARVYAKQPATRQVDWTLEPFLPVLDRRQALYVFAATEQGIRDAVAWAAKQNVRIVLQTGADAQRVAGLLKQHDVPVILSSILSLPPRKTSSTPTLPGSWRAGQSGCSVRVLERRVPVLARRPVPGGPRRRLGTRAMTRSRR